MIAAKALDPVVGIDIHIIQPPGPVPPVPIPHPFIGLLMDPMDFAPIIGATVMVNGMPRATAGTGGTCVPSHIPIGGTFIKPPGNECEVFMGSSTVLADSDPLSFLGMPALSCHDIGMPPPPRLRKKRKTKSLVLPTSVVMAIPAGPPVLVGGPPTISIMALGMRAGMAGLGRAFRRLRRVQRGSRRMRGVSDRIHAAARRAMNRLGVPPSAQNRVHRSICTATGHPVDVATGKVFTDAVDFELPGPIPFRWERVWYSCSTYEGPLGHGWHHSYDMALAEDEANGVVALRMSDGRPVAFPTLLEGQEFYDRSERLTVLRDARGYGVRDVSGALFRFRPARYIEETQMLASLEDPSGNRIEFAYDSGDRLIAAVDSCGRMISFEQDAAGRITGVLLPHPTEPGQVVGAVTYRYDRHGHLVESYDALRHPTTYGYDDHLLVKETDRAGLSFHFLYDGLDPGARAVRTWGDGGVFDRTLAYDPPLGITHVRDGGGSVTRYHWNQLGLVERAIDPLGGVSTTEWDDHGLRVAATDADGNGSTWDYDERGNLVQQVDSLGHACAFEYDGDRATALIAPDGGRWERRFDALGRLVSTSDPSGNVFEYAYDRRGLLSRVSAPTGEEMVFEYDPAGLPLAEVDWRGGRTSFAHDLLGRLARVDLPGGRVFRMERDLRGQLVKLHRPDGTERHFAYDAAGLPRAVQNEAGAMWHFQHGLLGRLTQHVAPDGAGFNWSYDSEGRVARVHNRLGESAMYERDAIGRVVRHRSFDGTTTHYRYAGFTEARSVAVAPDGAETRREFDPFGQLSRLTDRVGRTTEYSYDWFGRVVSAENDIARVEFQYDTSGHLVQEQVGIKGDIAVPQRSVSIRSEYDRRGRRTGRHSSFGETVGLTYDPNGWLAGVEVAGVEEVFFLRDESSRQVSATLPGGMRVRCVHNALGQLIVQEAEGPVEYQRRYEYHALSGIKKIEHDGALVLGALCDTEGRIGEIYQPHSGRSSIPRDTAGNALRSSTGDQIGYGPGGRVNSLGTEEWSYDAHGNLVEARGVGGRTTYEWDGANRLTAVWQEDVLTAEFGYDPFGRRLWKKVGDAVTQFIWDGDRLAAEQSPDETCEYVFEPLSFSPVLRVRNGAVEAYHVDHIGTPFLLTDARGGVVWEGNPDLENGVVGAGRGVRQPLRYQGQYHDAETGLFYNRHRYYHPGSGRYISADPLGLSAGLDVFAYVPNPLAWIDPFGLQFERPYGRDEVGEILDQSEGRPSPATGQDGHPRSSHVDVSNADIRARADAPGPPATVTTFEGSAAQNRAATESLNSPAGQAELRRLDTDPTLNRVRTQTDVGGETLRTAQRGRGYITRQTGRRIQTTVIVDVLDRTPGAERIHIQTCYGRY